MAEASRFGRRHPLCTCPDLRGLFGVLTVDVQPDCPGGTVAHPPPLSAEEMMRTLRELSGTLLDHQHRMEQVVVCRPEVGDQVAEALGVPADDLPAAGVKTSPYLPAGVDAVVADTSGWRIPAGPKPPPDTSWIEMTE
jgi:hypothetical protein